MEICHFFSYNSIFSNYELISQQEVQRFADNHDNPIQSRCTTGVSTNFCPYDFSYIFNQLKHRHIIYYNCLNPA